MSDRISEIIDSHGWAVMKVEGADDEPNYAYSLGLFKSFSHPEVIAFGLSPEVLQQMINTIGEEVRKGNRFEVPSSSSEIIEGYECAFHEVDPRAVHYYMGGGLRFYGEDFPVIHCIWPDRAGHFPWEADADDAFRRLQPMLSKGPEPYTHVRP